MTQVGIVGPAAQLTVVGSELNGLRVECALMVDKITTVNKSRLGARVGRLDDEDMLRFNRAALVFLGLAASRKAKK